MASARRRRARAAARTAGGCRSSRRRGASRTATVAVCSSLLGLVQREPDLAGHVGHRGVGELGQQQDLALGQRQLGRARRAWRGSRGRACGRGGRCGRSGGAARAARRAAAPTPPGPPAARPCASGARRRRTRRAPRCGRPAGRRSGAKVCWSSRGAGGLVEVVELVGGLHGRPRYGSTVRMHGPVRGCRDARRGQRRSGAVAPRGEDGGAMTSLLPARRGPRTAAEARRRRGTGDRWCCWRCSVGSAAAAGPLVVCLAVGVVGWFLTDAGAHGAPRDGLRAGALGWLIGHGSGSGRRRHDHRRSRSASPWSCAWSVWRIAHRVGDSVSGHGPTPTRSPTATATGPCPIGRRPVHRGVRRRRGRSRCARSARRRRPPRRARGWSSGRCCCAWCVGGRRSRSAPGGRRSGRRSCRCRCGRPSTVCLKVVSHVPAGLGRGASWWRWPLDLGTALNVMSELHTDAGEATPLLRR